MKNNKGFSLIELSIVLIIMGLLIAGVTGGSSLIKSAQLRSVITESQQFKTAYNAYYTANGEVPSINTSLIESSDESWGILKDANILDQKYENGRIKSKFKTANWYLHQGLTNPYGAGINTLVLAGVYATSGSTGTTDLKSSDTIENILKPALLGEDAKSIEKKMDDGETGKSGSGSLATFTGLIAGIGGKNETETTTCEYSDKKELLCNLVFKLDF